MLNLSAAPMCSEVITFQTATSKTYTWDDFDGLINFLTLGTTANLQIGDGSTSASRWSKIVIVSRPFTTQQTVTPVIIQTSPSITYIYNVPNDSYLLIRYGSSPAIIGNGPNVTRTSA